VSPAAVARSAIMAWAINAVTSAGRSLNRIVLLCLPISPYMATYSCANAKRAASTPPGFNSSMDILRKASAWASAASRTALAWASASSRIRVFVASASLQILMRLPSDSFCKLILTPSDS
jgi:hypothetical protein